ncbi:MAG: hypothetical protein ACXQT3_02160, partial [Methermicoccaceae archaeon]
MIKLRWESELKETELGRVPREWEIAILGDESKFKIIMGQSPSSKYYNQDGRGMPFVQGKTEF